MGVQKFSDVNIENVTKKPEVCTTAQFAETLHYVLCCSNLKLRATKSLASQAYLVNVSGLRKCVMYDSSFHCNII